MTKHSEKPERTPQSRKTEATMINVEASQKRDDELGDRIAALDVRITRTRGMAQDDLQKLEDLIAHQHEIAEHCVARIERLESAVTKLLG